MFQNIDPTVLGIVSTAIALAWGFFYMRGRYERGQQRYENSVLKPKKKQPAPDLETELKKIEGELSGKSIPKELQFDDSEKVKSKKPESKVIPFKRSEEPKPVQVELVSLQDALQSTRSGFFGKIKGLFEKPSLSQDDLEAIEEVLYTSDLGPKTVQRLLPTVTQVFEGSGEKTADSLKLAIRNEMLAILESANSGNKNLSEHFAKEFSSKNKPEVWMVVGVNGAGKTTTIGKLAHKLASNGKTVLVAAGDTFRAAAGEQLKVWSERAKVEIFSPEGIDNPSAIAFDACKLAQSKHFDYLILDTAGRLHTQKNLMEELKKVKRVIDKSQSGAPHQTLLIVDANAGQNALIQAKEFHAALDVSAVVLTKLDGTAKGGMAVAVAAELGLPIQLIGVGEKQEDLRPFNAKEFVDAIL
jgi:fused signal recognition particle receptor